MSAATPPIEARRSLPQTIGNFLRDNPIYVAIAGLVLVTSFVEPRFLTPRQLRQHHPVIRDADLRRPRDDLRDHGGVHRPLHRGHHLARGRGDRHADRPGRTGSRHPHRPLGRPGLRVDQQHPDHLERGPDPGGVAVHHLRHEPGLWRSGADVRPGCHAVPDVFGERHLDLQRDQLGHDRVPVRLHRDGCGRLRRSC